MKLSTTSTIITSFFDESHNKTEIWKTGTMDQMRLCEHHLEGTFYTRNSTKFFKDFKPVHLSLHRGLLILQLKRGDKNVYYIDLDEGMYTIELITQHDKRYSKSKKYAFSLYSNGVATDLYIGEKNFFHTWLHSLAKYCIMTNFDANYRIVKPIGSGGYGKVYLVDNLNDNKQYAAKYITVSAIKSKDKQKEMILNEIKILRRLSHPNIIQLIEVYESLSDIIIIMELADGEKLLTYIIDNKCLKEREAAQVMRQLFMVLSYLDSKNIIHRDIKPENIIVKHNFNGKIDVKLLDFGLATYLTKKDSTKKCGTGGFIAPEIFRTDHYDGRIDIYSCGAVLYAMPPFSGSDYNDIIDKNKKGIVKFGGKNWVRLSTPAKDMCQKLLDANPNYRMRLDEAMHHEWFKNMLSAEDKEALIGAMKSDKNLVPEEEKISDVPNSPVDLKRQLRSTNNSGLMTPSIMGKNESMMLKSINSFYKESQYSSISSDKSLGSLSSVSNRKDHSRSNVSRRSNNKNATLTLPGTINRIEVKQDYHQQNDTVQEGGYKIHISRIESHHSEDLTSDDESSCSSLYVKLQERNNLVFKKLYWKKTAEKK